MKDIFLTTNILILILSIVINLYTYQYSLTLTFFNILFSIFIFILASNILEKYDYEKENPNALVKGKNISGTVYSCNEKNTPGLGWIL